MNLIGDLLKNKDKATYEDYKKVVSNLREKMFPELCLKHKRKEPSYFEMVDYSQQIEILEKEFPEFNKMEIDEFNEFSKKFEFYIG